MKRQNKKGFTLIELLAVIVILAIIMTIAVTSISSIIDSSRVNATVTSMKEIIDGFNKHSIDIVKSDGDYFYISKNLLEAGAGEDYAFGGKFIYKTITGKTYEKAAGTLKCDSTNTVGSWVAKINGEYQICLVVGTGSGASVTYSKSLLHSQSDLNNKSYTQASLENNGVRS